MQIHIQLVHLTSYVGLWYQIPLNHVGCVMVIVLASSVVDRGFEPRSDQTKDYKIARSIKEKEKRLVGWESG
jgi:hypothetical protein